MTFHPAQWLSGEKLPEADDALTSFIEFVESHYGIEPYPAQLDAFMELAAGSNVIMATPTGSGKSLVAYAALCLNPIVNPGTRSYYTAPIKALVSEKFFSLGEELGHENVGMITGDSTINPDAPVICCTAEILANVALRNPGPNASVGAVVMDEFHYYGDPERGWAWQVPLIDLPAAQFVLMSATLGDTSEISADLDRRTGRQTVTIEHPDRPVPLEYHWAVTPVPETIEKLQAEGRTPVYVVHFSQREAVERAQALSSLRLVTREQRDEISDAIGDFRFLSGFGQTLSRLVRGGIGVHHAGMLPRYRRLVEQLAGQGLLRVICGTDTLGVGINVPIRTVLLTALSKYDGHRVRPINAREFHQIAGRAGRAGFDTQGDVVVQAPEFEIENLRALAKAENATGKKRKVVRKQPPRGFVSWNEQGFRKLIAARPEPLRGRMAMSSAILINVVAGGGDVVAHVRRLIDESRIPPAQKFALARRALTIFRSLKSAGIVVVTEDGQVTLTVDLPPHFALNQPLSAFAIAAQELIDPDSETATRDRISIVEATLEDPGAILAAQREAARAEAIARWKAEGIDYDERMALLEEISYPQPLAELLDAAYRAYIVDVPWAADTPVRPKSILRDMIEHADDFRSFVTRYGLSRSEGTVLRYLSDVYRALRQTIAPAAGTELAGIVEWLGMLIRGTDSSLVDEWSELVTGADGDEAAAPSPPAPGAGGDPSRDRGLRILVGNALWRRVELAAWRQWDALGELDAASGWGARRWQQAVETYFDEYDQIGTGQAARSAQLTSLVPDADGTHWTVRQVFDDPEGDHDWGITARVDVPATLAAGAVQLEILAVGPHESNAAAGSPT